MKKLLLLLIVCLTTSQSCSSADAFSSLSNVDKIKAGSLLTFALMCTAQTCMFGSAAIIKWLKYFRNEETTDNVPSTMIAVEGTAVSAVCWYYLKKYYNI